MNINQLTKRSIICLIALFIVFQARAQFNFSPSGLAGESLNNPTSLQFGPDGRLYVSQQNGIIYAYTVVRNAPNDYQVTATETINLVRDIPNHNSDGTLNTGQTDRQVTGILVRGTASNPVLYVSSSDPRIGGGGGATNTNLDENSGVLSRLSWNGSSWDMVHLVRGFPRSEENHAVNGMTMNAAGTVLYLCVGGHTNKGAPSNNFTFLPEFAYSAAIVSIDLQAIDGLPTQTDAQGHQYKYNLPTLDDEDKTNVANPTAGYEDMGDPWGGNGGKNQAMLVPGGPVQIHSSGWRNHYDVVITQAGRMYTFDNGPNSGWGGTPLTCTNQVNEANSGSQPDNLHFVSGPGYYGGHPNPTRANRSNTFNTTNPQSPIPIGMEDANCNYLVPGSQDGALATINSSTNGLCEYTASNFGGGLQGNLLAAAFNGNIYRFALNSAGNLVTTQSSLFSGFGSTPLDVIAQGDADPFPGTVWACTYGSNNITIFEPADFITCSGTDSSLTADFDSDGYSNGDELLNGTDQCNASSKPADWDQDFLSDLLDNDDDNDGLNDVVDLFARDHDNGTTTQLPVSYQFDNSVDPGINGWGFTGLMNDGVNDYMDLYDDGRMTVGGAALKFTIDSVEAGDALVALNDQRYAFQFGLNTSQIFLPFTVENRVMGPFATTTPANDMSQGVYIGTGDQDNYLKAVVHANGGNGGIEVVYEVGGSVSNTMYSVPAVIGAGSVELFLNVDPMTREVEVSYSISQGARSVLGSPVVIPASWLNNVLAVGQIATSRNAPAGYAATWDYLTVSPDPNTSAGQWYDVTYNSPAPTNRHENSFVQVGDRFYLVGGRGNKPVQAFNIADSTWTTLANPPLEIHHFQAVEYKGMIWCVGAMTGGFPNETPLPNIHIYDPVSDTWHVGPTIPANRRRGSSGIVVYNDEIYIVSGIQNGHVSGWVNWVDKFNPETNTWTVLANAPRERDHWQAQLVGDKIYCVGGRRSGANGTFAATVAEVDVYDIPTDSWTTLPASSNIPTQRAAGVIGVLGDEVVLAGGESGGQSAAHEETEALHVHNDSWRSLAPMIDSRHGSSAITNNGGLWVAAGSGNQGGSPELNTMEVFFFNGPRQPVGSPVTAGTFASNPASYDYGQVVTGDSAVNTFTLSNSSGNQGMLIKGLTYAGDPDFSGTLPFSLPVVLPPGGSISFPVTFVPGAAGPRSASLQITTNQSASPLSIALNGEGVGLVPLYRVNCGGPAYTAVNNDAFSADAFFTGGSTSSTGNVIAGTQDDVLYQTERYGNFDYAFPVSGAGLYEIRLHFAEIWTGGQSVGARVFSLALEGSNVLSNYDIYDEVGGYTAVIRTFQVPVTDGTLNLSVTAQVDNPKISAIEVFSAGSVPGPALASHPDPLHFFSQQTGTTSAPQDLHLVNTGSNSLNVTAINISGANAADFSFSFSLPVSIPGGDSVLVPFTFTPSTVGLKFATVTVTHSGTNSPLSSSLTGEAVDLTFSASASVVQQVNCAGGSDGSAAVSLTNGMAPFSYLWMPSGQTTDTASGLSEGSYTVRVIDMNNDTAFAAVDLVADTLFASTTVCRDQANNNLGQAVVTATGGASPYSYLWDANAGNSTNDSVSGLPNGSYTVTVTDDNGCTAAASVTVNGVTATCDTCALPNGWVNQDIGAVGAAGGVCYDSQTQEWTADGSGADIWGTADEFQFAYRQLTGDGEIIARVTAITNTDQWAKAGVMMRTSLNANSANAMMLKRGANGYSWQWRPTAGTNSQFSGNTSSTTFPLWVRVVRSGNSFTGYHSADGQNWTQQGAAQTIAMPNTIYVGLAVTSHNDGAVNTSVFDNVQVIGASGPALTASPAVTSGYNGEDVSCNGSTDGEATVTASGGTPPYTYQWDAAASGQTTATASGLGAGTYSVTVTDNNSDTAVASVILTEPALLSATAVQTNPASAPGQPDGSATASATGGISPYSYQWDANTGSQTTSTASNIADGTYSVTVTDANGCTALASVTVDTLPAPPAFALRINAGGPQYISTANDTFVADVHFVNGQTYSTTQAIANTNDDVLYQTERYLADLQYAIPVPNGDYDVILHFAEIYVGAPGGGSGLGAGYRIFDAVVEGDTVLDDIDLFASFGTLTAYVHTMTGVAVSDGNLNLNFPASANNGKISAIEVISAPPASPQPYVVNSIPADGAINVFINTSITTDVFLPNGSIDGSTLDSASVFLYPSGSPASVVPAILNTTGGGDAIILTPSAYLQPNTQYTFEVTGGLQDITATGFQPFMMSFTTGTAVQGGGGGNMAFEKVNLPNTAGASYTTVTIGPDGKLYASQDNGLIHRWEINVDGTLSGQETLNSLQTAEGGNRLLIGLTFDPASTDKNLVAWVSHSFYGFSNQPDWGGKITRLSGENLQNVQDFVVNLPRSSKDHVTNSVVFGPDGVLYVNQGSNSAMGAPDNTWSNRPERKLSAATLRIDLAAIGSPPLDVKTAEGGSYDPYAANAPVKVFGSGIRNAYDLVWHSNGNLYIPANGSAAGGNTPASVPGIIRPDGSPYAGPAVPAINGVSQTQNDYLFRVPAPIGGNWGYHYYGHPNPTRGEYVMNGGNPSAGADPGQVNQYPVGIQPDADWAGFAYNFTNNKSPNGVIEYQSGVFNGGLQGQLLVVRYSANDDIIALDPGGTNGDISGESVGITGFTGFNNPLDLCENPVNGHLYVSEYGGAKITLLRPVDSSFAAPSIAVEPDEVIYDGVKNNVTGPKTVSIVNNGTDTLIVSGASFTGPQAGMFSFATAPGFPLAIAPWSSTSLSVNFTPGASIGAFSGLLNLSSNDPGNATLTQGHYGLSTNGLEGNNEPPLHWVCQTLGYNIDVGGTTLVLGTGPGAIGDEVLEPLFRKAGPGDVSMIPVARYSPAEPLPYGYYLPGTTPTELPVGTLDGTGTEHQTLMPNVVSGGTNFDPGAQVFGFYTASAAHTTYTGDGLNTGPTGHAARVYPLKDRQGNAVPNTYLVGFEEASNGDYQDYVFVVCNVRPQGGNLLASNDPLNFGPRNINTANTLSLSLSNPGNINVDISALTIGGDAAFTLVNAPVLPVTVNAGGGSISLDIQFLPTSTGIKNATLDLTHDGNNNPLSVSLTGEGIDPNFNATAAVVQQLSCADGSDGIATVTTVNGTPPYTYLWTPSGQTTDTATGLSGGQYTVMVIDQTNDTAYASITLAADTLFATASACYDQSATSGNAHVNVSGGAGPYSYQWDANAGSSTNDSVPGLAFGTYLVTVTDVNNCTATASVTIDGNTPACDSCALPPGWANQDVGAVAAAGDVCYQADNQTFTVDGSGADIWNTADEFHFVYQSLSGDGEIIARVTSITQTDVWAKAGVMMRTNLSSGSQNVLMLKRGANGYSFQSRATANAASTSNSNQTNQILPLWVRIVRSGNDFSGYYSADGVNWTQQGGTVTINMPTTLLVGLAVTSHNDGAINTSTFDKVQIIPAATSPVLSATVSSDYNGEDISCNGGSDGEATVNVSGGTPPYNYLWSNGATTATASGLSAGNHAVTVTDNGNQTANASVTLTDPAPLVAGAGQVQGVSFPGAVDGVAALAPSGGVPPYSIQWDTNAGNSTSDTVTGLGQGTYQVSVTDANGCTSLDSAVIGVQTAFALRINVNGPSYTAVNNDTFVADQPSAWVTGTQQGGTKSFGVANTNDDPMYLVYRFGSAFAYNVPVPNGDYTVILHFFEPYFGAPGGVSGGNGLRVFDVSLEGGLVMDDYDIYATVGAATADIYTFSNINVADGVMNIGFAASVNNGIISAIEILGTDGVAPLAASTSSPASQCGYQVSYAGGACVPATSSKLTADEPLGNHLTAVPSVKAYPNPFRNGFTLHFESKEVYGQLQVTVSDQHGKEVLRRSFLPDDGRYLDEEIALSGVAAGVYVVTVSSGDFSKRIRLVKL